ncbi:aldehyde dehydrogenase (NAD+) [Solimonas aquatica]|uniref:Aldehyde dehydrogenase n=1 Tax=Solimonas aquatica TaxID=489703 RepID=A0A1H9JF12_9GAMM|nr:aldehyde dehydrogenase family protein [Solimonas aquatica]SEQ85420.1 aldehyde dehydrogenase (NAD+) [Solimonas aquatica]
MNTVVSFLPNAHSASLDEIRRVFDAQWPTALRLRMSTAAERIAKIQRLHDAMLANRQALYDAAYRDFKKPPAEVDLGETLPVISEAKHTMRSLKRWMKPLRVWPSRTTMGTSSHVQFEPKGRCLIISPWNYPVNLTFGPLVSCIAAGNTAILKPSEMTPNMSALMVRIVREIFSPDEVAIFEGEADVSTALLALPFDHIFFTGSPAIGKVVMAAAAKNLTSVTLELGGKSPTIVDESANIKAAARTIMWGKYTNNGQTCIAPDYIYVHESVKQAFVDECTAVLRESYGKDMGAQLASPNLARVVNQRHTKRVAGLLQDAQQRGARVLCGGGVNENECFVQPTLLDNIPADARIQSEEIFGPLLPIFAYSDLDKAIAAINEQPKPLALYIWSRNERNIQRVLKSTSAGGTCINHVVMQFAQGNLPFGGVNNSGIGSAHGHYGFRAFSHERAVVRTRFNLATLLFPPYSNFTRRVLDMMVKTQ